MDQLLEASTTAELEAFDDPVVPRRGPARPGAQPTPTRGKSCGGWSRCSRPGPFLLAVLAVLLSVAPLLVPVALAGLCAHRRRQRLQHPGPVPPALRPRRTRPRPLLPRTAPHRPTRGQEVRAFGLAGWLRPAMTASSPNASPTPGGRGAPILLRWSGRRSPPDLAGIVGDRDAARPRRPASAWPTPPSPSWPSSSSPARLRGLGSATFNSMVEGVVFLRDFEDLNAGPCRRTTPTPAALADVPARHPPDPRSHRGRAPRYHYPAGDGDALVDVNLDSSPVRSSPSSVPTGPARAPWPRSCAGSCPPARARIRWDDVDTAQCDPADGQNSLVAPVFQDFTRFEHTGRQVIGFGDIDRLDDDAGDPKPRRPGPRRRVPRVAGRRATTPGCRRRSPTAPNCPSASGSGWRSPGPSSATHRSSSWTSRPPHSTRRPNATCSTACANSDATAWCCSSRTASPPCDRADHILVLLDGRVAEHGTHDDLMGLGGVYAELYAMQAEQFS